MMEILGVGGILGLLFFCQRGGASSLEKLLSFLLLISPLAYLNFGVLTFSFSAFPFLFTFTSKTFLQFLSSCSLSLFLSILSCYLFRSLSLSSFPIQACFHFDLRLSTVIVLFCSSSSLYFLHTSTHTHTRKRKRIV